MIVKSLVTFACKYNDLGVISTFQIYFQIDLRFEARNIEHFRDNFRDVDYVKFPTPLRPFVTRTILVETFEVSTKLF